MCYFMFAQCCQSFAQGIYTTKVAKSTKFNAGFANKGSVFFVRFVCFVVRFQPKAFVAFVAFVVRP